MRPYLAIIKDSFREAMVSRVLWVLLILATGMLMVLAPMSITEQPGTSIAAKDILAPDRLLHRFLAEHSQAQPSPAKHIWKQFSPDYRELVDGLAQMGPSADVEPTSLHAVLTGLQRELDVALDNGGFYDADAWQNVELSAECSALIEQGITNLSGDERRRCNRLLLAEAFPTDIAAPSDVAYRVGYLKWTSAAQAFDKEDLLDGLLLVLINWVVGLFGVFLAILFTAWLIPRTFEAGSIDLLLSKPVSRSLVFLAKYVGGCSFIVILAIYAIGGLWLILGVRMDYWNARLLLCVPVFLFQFSIYYAVTSLVGLLFRSTIVSILLVIVFWAACSGIGVAKNSIEEGAKLLGFIPMPGLYLLQPSRIVSADTALLTVNEVSTVRQWVPVSREWKPVFTDDAGSRSRMPGLVGQSLVGPVYDDGGARLLAIHKFGDHLLIGNQDDDWRQTVGAELPVNVTALLVRTDGGVLVCSHEQVYQLAEVDGESEFIPVSPLLELNVRFVAALDPTTNMLVMYDHHKLVVLKPDDDGMYGVVAQTILETQQVGTVAIAGGRVLLGLADGTLRVYDSSLALKKEEQLEGRSMVRAFVPAIDGSRLLLVFHNRTLWEFDVGSGEFARPRLRSQGTISAVGFIAPTQIAVAFDYTRMDVHDAASWDRVGSYQATMNRFEKCWRYGLRPLYAIFPKPGELDQLVQYIMTKRETEVRGLFLEPSMSRKKLAIWQPVRSSMAFTVVVLALSCLYVARRDF